MSKYYEKTKSKYARDIDHLVTFNKNGLWIKENIKNNETRIITAEKIDDLNLINVTIFHLDKNYKLNEKIISKTTNIKNFKWILKEVKILELKDGFLNSKNIEQYSIQSIYDHEKITTLFKNFDTLPFLDILINYKQLLDSGYNKKLLDENLNSWLSYPFFCL